MMPSENMTSNPSSKTDNSYLHLNISGRLFAISEITIRSKLKNTLFSQLFFRNNNQTKKGDDVLPNCIFLSNQNYDIERCPNIFELILNYAYTGKLHCPMGVCDSMLLEEIKFWRLPEKGIENCCATGCTGGETPTIEEVVGQKKVTPVNQQNGKKFRQLSRVMSSKQLTRRAFGEETILDKIWRLFADPGSSWSAYILHIICVLFILLSITNFVISTVPELHHCARPEDNYNYNFSDNATNFIVNAINATNTDSPNSDGQVITRKLKDKFSRSCEGGFIFDIIEAVCIAWFTFEWLIRFVSCPDKRNFLKNLLNIIDIFATIPFYVELLVWLCDKEADRDGSPVLIFLRIMRIMRAFRILRLARYFDSLQLMGETLWNSRSELGLLLLFLSVSTIIFSTLLFYIEMEEPDTQYTSIPASFWWCVVTLTTTGYGDMTPSTLLGKIAAGCACIVGVLILAFPVTILVEKFRSRYEDKNKGKLKRLVTELSMQAIKLAQEKVSRDSHKI